MGFLSGKCISKKPWEYICSDIFGPVRYAINTENKKKHKLLTIQDQYSRFCELFLLKEQNVKEVVRQFEKWINRYPKPKQITSDNGRQYTSNAFYTFCEKNEIKRNLIPRLTPQANGMAESINKTLGNCLRIFKGFKITEILTFAKRQLNLTYNRGLRGIPYEIAFKVDLISGNKLSEEKIPNDEIVHLENRVLENSKRKDYKYQKGEMVYTKAFHLDKQSQKWNGPYKIIKVSKKGNSVLTDEVNKRTWNSIRNVRCARRGRMQ